MIAGEARHLDRRSEKMTHIGEDATGVLHPTVAWTLGVFLDAARVIS